MKSWSRVLVTGLAVASVAVGGVLAANATEPTAADVQQPLVEDFAYPDAARILAEDHVKLISGDGHIIYQRCAAQPQNGIGQIMVGSMDTSVGPAEDGRVCFKVLGNTGYVAVEIPQAFEVRGDGFGSAQGHTGSIEVVRGSGEHKTYEIKPNTNQQVGVGRNEDEVTLVKLEVKP